LATFIVVHGSFHDGNAWSGVSEDCAMPPGEWQLHPRMTSRLGLFRLVQMPGGHELMFSNPKGLTDSIIVASRD
jgi:hypothetical protein